MNGNLPTVLQICRNHTLVEAGAVSLWFSYRTLIAFQLEGHSQVVRQNDWGRVTGKHLNLVDGGSKHARAKRLQSQVFEDQYQTQIRQLLQQPSLALV